jgi:hypothetical protein
MINVGKSRLIKNIIAEEIRYNDYFNILIIKQNMILPYILTVYYYFMNDATLISLYYIT